MASRIHTTKKSKTTLPISVKPMLCTLLNKPFQNDDYIYEIKWDGYRIIAYKNGSEVRLDSRGGENYSLKYPSIIFALKKLDADVVLDGEVVVLNSEGKPDFDELQKFNGQRSGVYYYVFDILWKDGVDLTSLPLLNRKKILEDVISGSEELRFNDHFENGLALFDKAHAIGLEGIVAKKKNSQYIQNKRGKDWYKIPTSIKQEFVIGGWVESESGRPFRTLLFGSYKEGKLQWIGHAGGGFKDHEMASILHKLKTLEIAKSPFVNEVDYDGKAHWVKPELVANIKYATTTRSGKIRKPAIFLGFRKDKDPMEVVLEKRAKGPDMNSREALQAETGLPSESNWIEVDAEPIRNEETLQVDDCNVKVYNVDQRLWRGVTKADLLHYYHSIAHHILPHLKDRPLSLYLKLNGPYGRGVYIKDMEGRQPECAKIFTTERLHKKKGKRNMIDYLICNNIPTLLYLINLGCIDLNPWTSRATNPDQPDYVAIDLDPSDENFKKAIEAAEASKELFDKHKLKAFLKTSGKTGLHIFVPCRGLSFSQTRVIAENICLEIHRMVPDITTTKVGKAERGNRLYLDPNQNDFTDTLACVYSVRPTTHPTVSMPLEWRELKESMDPEDFDFRTTSNRILKKGDLFAGVLDQRIAQRNVPSLRKFLG